MINSYPFDLNSVLLQDHSSFVLETLLRYSDRNSMAFSREVRLPYLSHDLVDFVFSLDSSLKIKGGWQKYILRKTFENKIPDKIIWRKDKMGFSAPEQRWLENSTNQEFINENWLDLQNKGIIKKNIPLITQASWKILMLSSLMNFSKINFENAKIIR
ncbi:MAG: asparagine synthase [Crocinitomicaceae bacterium]|nr:asparagine synthase [Crocinitomicaceae bacterium]